MRHHLNTNDYVYFKLTTWGRQLLTERATQSLNYTCNDRSGIVRMQLWKAMNVFGSEMFNGAKQIFTNNRIDFHDPEATK